MWLIRMIFSNCMHVGYIHPIKIIYWISLRNCHFPLLSDLPSTGNTISVGEKKQQPAAAAAAAAGGGPVNDADADLEERLNNLRRQWPWTPLNILDNTLLHS